jgi:uncharacterized protein (DUF2236 family)
VSLGSRAQAGSVTVTTGLCATATGLIERSATAYVSGVPEDAADAGLFGPASVAWRMSTDLASPVAGLRSLLMQALHPLAMAGADQHSGWRRDPGDPALLLWVHAAQVDSALTAGASSTCAARWPTTSASRAHI